MNYNEHFNNAVIFSKENDILNKYIELSERKLSKKELNNIIKLAVDYLIDNGFKWSHQIAFKCGAIHYILSEYLSSKNIINEVTIGDLYADGEAWMDYSTIDELLKEAHSPDVNKEINFHCWITLGDGTVLDFTHLAEHYKNSGQCVDIISCLCVIKANTYNPIHYYIPRIVGREYILKSKVFEPNKITVKQLAFC
ncbi:MULTISPECIES: hypothetical protein [Photobacterium]|uniref:hypothetical protein n=1 Tax=Photobacterium TaxID=657 RepID=UPI001E4736F8|nr:MULTISPECIES: hypothetical protein [Photobacterium]MCD9474422.1 hypothetical protein [Photobacterium phosphoreum]MCD9536766.1 hypothetical protein [Photobacterium carnosum]MCF2161598.1 hypothetical protein [Photobacterium carnosum]MCF2174831.1 hypothetical protein [Photobacterium phosphoreum]